MRQCESVYSCAYCCCSSCCSPCCCCALVRHVHLLLLALSHTHSHTHIEAPTHACKTVFIFYCENVTCRMRITCFSPQSLTLAAAVAAPSPLLTLSPFTPPLPLAFRPFATFNVNFFFQFRRKYEKYS